jgi:hypothetical protein
VVQNRINDAGFADLVITPMGADKVFMRRAEGGDVWSVVAGAEDFFRHVFSNWTRWDADGRSYQRGAWVRLYGVPLSAWNVDFFKLCVFECGRFIRADSCSAEKDRLDFARVLIATPDLTIVSKVERVLVDGVQVDIKIVEEWGYAMGEDTCLFEEESGSEPSQDDEGVGFAEPEASKNVDLLVEKFVDEDEDEEGDEDLGQSGVKTPNLIDSTVGDSEECGSGNEEVCSPVRNVALLPLSEDSPGGSKAVRTAGTPHASASQVSPTSRAPDGLGGIGVRHRSGGTRATSCPPSEDRRG